MTVGDLKSVLNNIADHVPVKLYKREREHGGNYDLQVEATGVQLIPNANCPEWNCVVILGKEF